MQNPRAPGSGTGQSHWSWADCHIGSDGVQNELDFQFFEKIYFKLVYGYFAWMYLFATCAQA